AGRVTGVRRVRTDRKPTPAEGQRDRAWTAVVAPTCRAARWLRLSDQHTRRGLDLFGDDPDGVPRRRPGTGRAADGRPLPGSGDRRWRRRSDAPRARHG